MLKSASVSPSVKWGRLWRPPRGFLRLAGHEVREINEDGEELYPRAEVFPDSHPGKILRGARVREDITQAALAEKARLKPHHISEMENGKRAHWKRGRHAFGRSLER